MNRWIGAVVLAVAAAVSWWWLAGRPSAPEPGPSPAPPVPASEPTRHAVIVTVDLSETETLDGKPKPDTTRSFRLGAAWTEVLAPSGALGRADHTARWTLHDTNPTSRPDKPLAVAHDLDGSSAAGAPTDACQDVAPASRPDAWIHAASLLGAAPKLDGLERGETWKADGATLLAELNGAASPHSARYAEAELVGGFVALEDRAGIRVAHLRATGHARRGFGTAGYLEQHWVAKLEVEVASRRIVAATAKGAIHEPRGCEPGTSGPPHAI